MANEQPAPVLLIEHYKDLMPGDEMILGKRAWRFAGNTTECNVRPHEQEESVWDNASPDPGAVDVRRVMAWSEVTALLDAGIPFTRTMPVKIAFCDRTIRERKGYV